MLRDTAADARAANCRSPPISRRIETAEAFRRHLDDIFADVDVLLTPSAAGEAPEGLGSTGDPSFNSIWTLAWTPCVTLPAGTGPQGLAARHPARRPALPRRSAARRRRLGRSPAFRA